MIEPYYQYGACSIYHGDARDIVPNLCADSIVTDPPFKLSQEYSASTDSDNLMAVASIAWLPPMMLDAVPPGSLAAVFYDTRILPLALEAFRRGGWKYLRALTFYRRWGQASKLHGWMSTSDFVLLFTKPGAKPHFYADTKHDVYIKAGPEVASSNHPAQKPLDAVVHLVENVTPPEGTVLDPYMGSGTTLVAAQRCKRRAIGVEIEERYCEIAATRLSQEVLAL